MIDAQSGSAIKINAKQAKTKYIVPSMHTQVRHYNLRIDE